MLTIVSILEVDDLGWAVVSAAVKDGARVRLEPQPTVVDRHLDASLSKVDVNAQVDGRARTDLSRAERDAED